MNDLVPSPAPAVLPALFAPTPKAAKRFVEFFTTLISNEHTRKAYLNALSGKQQFRATRSECLDHNFPEAHTS